MTLDEAIKHAEEVASRKFDDRVHCIKCAEEHRQLAEWLKDYKRLLEQQPTTTTNNNEPITVIYPTIVCDDAISREDAEQMFRNIRSRLKPQDYKSAEEFNTRDLMLLNAEQMIHALPSVMHKSGKWIPVSERLPEYNGWYQCTANLDDLLLTVDLYYKNGKWLDNRRINMFDTYEIYGYGNSTEKHKLSYEELISEFDWTANVIAWMPLPEPYEPQEGANE